MTGVAALTIWAHLIVQSERVRGGLYLRRARRYRADDPRAIRSPKRGGHTLHKARRFMRILITSAPFHPSLGGIETATYVLASGLVPSAATT